MIVHRSEIWYLGDPIRILVIRGSYKKVANLQSDQNINFSLLFGTSYFK